MKGNDKVIATLDELLADELTAISQYMVHSEMCNNWGYARLHERVEKRAMQEMKHAERLITRIIFLEGKPTVSRLEDMHIGEDVEKQLRNDHAAENDAIVAYNRAIREAHDLSDAGTKGLLEEILKEEEAHLDWIEAQLDQLDQVGLQNFLAQQLRE